MKTSTNRLLTTHTGSLPRPKPLVDLILDREKGNMVEAPAFETETANAVDGVVAHQIGSGIDVVSDGEMSKPSYTTYIRHRISGIEPDHRAAEKGHDIMLGRDLLEHPDFAQERGNFTNLAFPGCVGELRTTRRCAQQPAAIEQRPRSSARPVPTGADGGWRSARRSSRGSAKG